MTFPVSVRAHQIADYWYCAERSRLMACKGLEAPESDELHGGLKVHKWLEQRPKSKAETELWGAIECFSLQRRLDGVEIVAHPDDLTVLGKNKVQIIEYKTVDKPVIKPWKFSVAQHQLRIYCWVLKPTLEHLGYELAHRHCLIFLNRAGVFLKKASVESDDYCTERAIREIFSFWAKGEPLIAPMKWKCGLCPKIFREACRIFRGEAHGLRKR